jgi:hypothetical protein
MTWIKKSLAILIIGSLAWDPAAASVFQALEIPHPTTVLSNRLSAEALNAVAIWQRVTPSLTIRHRLTQMSVGLVGVLAGAKAVSMATASVVAPIAVTVQSVAKVVTLHASVHVTQGASYWSLASRWLGGGQNYTQFGNKLGTLHPGLIDLPQRFDLKLLQPGQMPSITLIQQPLETWQRMMLHWTSPESLLCLAAILVSVVATVWLIRSVLRAPRLDTVRTPRRSLWRHPLFKPVVAGVQLALLVMSSLPGVAAVKSMTDLFNRSTDQVSQQFDLKKKKDAATDKAAKYKAPLTLGVQSIFEKYEGNPDPLKYVGPNVTAPKIPLPHLNPLRSVEHYAADRSEDRASAEKRKALRDYLDVLTPAAGAYAEKTAYVEALTEGLNVTTDAAQRTALAEALDLAKNQQNEAFNKLREALKLPQADLSETDTVSIPKADGDILQALNEALNKPGMNASTADADSEIAAIDARIAGRKDSVLQNIRWWHRLPTGFSTSLSFNVINWGFLPAGLANSTLLLPQYDTLDADKDRKTIESGKAALTTAQQSAQARLEQAFQDWNAAAHPSINAEDPLEAAEQRAALIFRQWNAVSDMNHFGVIPGQMNAWVTLSDADRKVEIAVHVRGLFRDALPAYQSWEAVLPQPTDVEAAPAVVTVDPLTLGVAGSNKVVPVYNGQAQLGTVTGLISTNVKFNRNVKKIAGIKKDQDAARKALEAKTLPEDSVEYWKQANILRATTIRIADETRDPIVLNPGFQQSGKQPFNGAYSYPWVYLDTKKIEQKIATMVVHLFHKPKSSDAVARSVTELNANFNHDLAHTFQQIKLNDAVTTEGLEKAEQALVHQQALPEDKEALQKAEADVAAAQTAYTQAHATYTAWQTYAVSGSASDTFWFNFVNPLWDLSFSSDAAEYSVRAAEFHETIVTHDKHALPLGPNWDSNTFLAALLYDPAIGSLKNSAFTGQNVFTNYDPAARSTARDLRTDEVKKAHEAVVAARQNAAFQRAVTYPELAATVAEVDRLTAFAAHADVPEPLRHQALILSNQASATGLKQGQVIGISMHAVAPLSREEIQVLNVPNTSALVNALLHPETPALTAHLTSWFHRVLKPFRIFNVPVNGIHYVHFLAETRHYGTQATAGAIDVKEALGGPGAKRLANQKDAAEKAESKLSDAMTEQEMFYKVSRLIEVIHGKTAGDGKVVVPGLVAISGDQAAHTEGARLALMRAVEQKADDAKIFVLFHRWRKSATVTDGLLAQTVQADRTLRALVSVLSPEELLALGITQVALSPVAAVTLPVEPVAIAEVTRAADLASETVSEGIGTSATEPAAPRESTLPATPVAETRIPSPVTKPTHHASHTAPAPVVQSDPAPAKTPAQVTPPAKTVTLSERLQAMSDKAAGFICDNMVLSFLVIAGLFFTLDRFVFKRKSRGSGTTNSS